MPLTSGWRNYCKKATADLKKVTTRKKFDMICCTGVSGSCVGWYVAVALDVPMLYARKEPTKTGGYGIKRTLIYDDIDPDTGEYVIQAFWRKNKRAPVVCFIDDWIGGGGSRRETAQLVHAAGGDVRYQYLYARESQRDGGFKAIPAGSYREFGPVRKLRKGYDYA